MALILSQSRVCDGLDVRVRLSNGQEHTFHAAQEPTDVQAWVDAAEQQLLAAVEPPVEIETEGGSLV